VADLIVIQHGQASFGAQNYDVLSELGHRQAVAMGQRLAAIEIVPTGFVTGNMRRQCDTMEGLQTGMGRTAAAPQVHLGLNEFDFEGLLKACYRKTPPPADLISDRKSHFRSLRATVLAWQRDEIDSPPESWAAFTAWVEAARQFLTKDRSGPILAVSSGGGISQMKNCAVTRFFYSPRAFFCEASMRPRISLMPLNGPY
jgi:broad specificity phosphatase PhoE